MIRLEEAGDGDVGDEGMTLSEALEARKGLNERIGEFHTQVVNSAYHIMAPRLRDYFREVFRLLLMMDPVCGAFPELSGMPAGEKYRRMRIPVNPATSSGGKRPPKPKQGGHPSERSDAGC